jgi:hypothetical protein
MPRQEVYNKTTGRFNTVPRAVLNGLFDNPSAFELPDGYGLNLQTRRLSLVTTLGRKLKKAEVEPNRVYAPGFVVLPRSRRLAVATPENQQLARRQRMAIPESPEFEAMMRELAERTAHDEVYTRTHQAPRVGNIRDFRGVAAVYEFTTARAYRNIRERTVAEKHSDLLHFGREVCSSVLELLMQRLHDSGPFKLTLGVRVTMVRLSGDDYIPSQSSFVSSSVKDGLPILSTNDLFTAFTSKYAVLVEMVEAFERNGSCWTLDSIDIFEVKIINYVPFRGASYVPLPEWLARKKCCVNVRNTDNRCFEYAVLSALHYDSKQNPDRVSCYDKHKGELTFDGIEFPVSQTSYERFEQLNQHRNQCLRS